MRPVLKLLVLKTHSLEKVKAFYECLGIQFVAEKHGKGPAHFAGRVGETVLEVYPLPPGERADSSTRLGVQVDQRDTVLSALAEFGVSVPPSSVRSPGECRVVVKDPDGRAVELYWE